MEKEENSELNKKLEDFMAKKEKEGIFYYKKYSFFLSIYDIYRLGYGEDV